MKAKNEFYSNIKEKEAAHCCARKESPAVVDKCPTLHSDSLSTVLRVQSLAARGMFSEILDVWRLVWVHGQSDMTWSALSTQHYPTIQPLSCC